MTASRFLSRPGPEIAIIIAVAAVSIYAHAVLGYVCPLPWPDESHFLWPSISLAEHGTFLSPELNPDRPIFWMPHGYMALMGGIFSITGSSLATARYLSLFCVLASLMVLFRILRRFEFSFLSMVIAGWFFVNAYFIACGNVARMEAALMLLVFGAFALLYAKRVWSGVALLLFAPLIHPNGFYFLAAAIVYAAVEWWRSGSRPQFTKSALIFMAVAAVCWIGYAIYLSGYWSVVKQDLAFQFARKGERSILGQVLTADNFALGIMLVIAIVLSIRTKQRHLELLFLGVPCWAIQVIGFEMWYRVFWMLAALIVTTMFVESIREFANHKLNKVDRYTRAGLIVVLTAVCCGWHLYRGNLESPIRYPYRMKFFEMSTPDATPYMTEDDRLKVTGIINREAALRPITVQFFPRAEALLNLDVRSDRVRFSDPLFHERRADLYVFHESRYLPPRWIRFLANDMAAAGLDPSTRAQFVAFQRNNHELWYVFKP